MPGKAAKVVISERQQEILEKMVRSSTSQQRWIIRARIILLAFAGHSNDVIGQQVGLGPDQVGLWRRRWRDQFERLVLIECVEGLTLLRRAIETLLSDAPRSGSPGTFTPEQVTRILALACESPEDCGRPVTHWTARELADEAQKRGIVESISPRQVGRFLKSGRSQAPSG